ncbi:MAG TPA: PAS domain S-box protein [Caldisericia bacterium]|nr:PAS domain S-box protein [Caldisericia bacterium]
MADISLDQRHLQDKRLISFLQALRSIQKLVSTAKDKNEFLQKTCDSLTQYPGYMQASILLLHNQQVVSIHSSSLNPAFSYQKDKNQWVLPRCVIDALQKQKSILITTPALECPQCPYSKLYKEQVGCVQPLVYQGKQLGMLHISAPSSTFEEEDEKKLFHELVNDITFALHQMDLSQRLKETQEKYTSIFKGSRDGFVMVNLQGKIIDANNAYCQLLGYTLEELKKFQSFYDFTPVSWHKKEKEKIWEKDLMQKGESGLYEKEYIHKDGHVFPVELQAYAVGTPPDQIEYLWASVRDVSEKKRIERELLRSVRRLESIINILQYPFKDLQDFLDYALDRAVQLTNSKLGYLYLYNEQTKVFQIKSWSKKVFKECSIVDPPKECKLNTTGIWGEAVRQRKPILINDYKAPHTLKKGLPEGHVPLHRFLTIPIFHQNSIKAVIGVANKEEDYNATDSLELTLLMDAVWKTIESISSEDAVLESKNTLRSYIDNAPYGIFVVNEKGEYVDVNREASNITGYSMDELLRMSIQSFVDPEYLQKGLEHFKEVKSKGHAEGEYMFVHKNGTSRWMHITATKLSNTKFIGFLYDITDQKKSKEYITLLSNMLDISPASITIHNEKGQFLYINEKTLQIHGFSSKEEFMQINLHQLDVPESEEKILERMETITQKGEAQFEVEHYRKDGSRVPLEIVTKKILWENQIAILSIAVDITSRKQIENELQTYQVYLEEIVKQRTEELESLNHELESFAYSVAHDLRTPLRSIAGFSQLLLEDYQNQLDLEGKKYLGKIQKSTHKMGQLIDDLLILARVSRHDIKHEEVDLSSLARQILHGIQEIHPSRKKKINIQKSMISKGDSHLLSIALENILGNAWKFTKQNAITCIEFGCLPNHQCKVPSKDCPKAKTVFYIHDNGVGFDMRYADKLFLPFQRLHSDDSFSGTGIGLATVYRIIQRHHGRIWAYSEPGKGTTIYFTLL